MNTFNESESDLNLNNSTSRWQWVDAESILRIEFDRHVEEWRRATRKYSLTFRRYAHPSYQAILALGKPVIPLILQELKSRPDWWFEALKALSKSDPTSPGDNFTKAASAWIEWGKRNHIIL